MPQRNSEIPERKGEAAKKTHGRHGWPRERTHPPEVAAQTPSLGATLIHGGSVLHRPGRQDLLDESSSGSSRPRSSPAADRPSTKIRPDWSPFPSPSPLLSSPALGPPSSLSPSSLTRRARSSGAEMEANAADKSEEEGGGNEGALFKKPRPAPYMRLLPSG